MAKHTRTDGDAALDEAKTRRAAELEVLRANDPELASIIPQGWVRRETGFPPYLQMFVGAKMRVEVMMRDERDGTFPRYHLKLVAPDAIECRRGPADERGEPIAVRAGAIFTIGAYAALEPELNALMGLECGILCRKSRNLKDDPVTGEPRTLFEFDTYVSPETERMLLSERDEDRKYLKEAYRSARQLAIKNIAETMFEPKAKRAAVSANGA
jgi:hypothetical protein